MPRPGRPSPRLVAEARREVEIRDEQRGGEDCDRSQLAKLAARLPQQRKSGHPDEQPRRECEEAPERREERERKRSRVRGPDAEESAQMPGLVGGVREVLVPGLQRRAEAASMVRAEKRERTDRPQPDRARA